MIKNFSNSYNFVLNKSIQQLMFLLALLKILVKTWMKLILVVVLLLTYKKYLILLNMFFFYRSLSISWGLNVVVQMDDFIDISQIFQSMAMNVILLHWHLVFLHWHLVFLISRSTFFFDIYYSFKPNQVLHFADDNNSLHSGKSVNTRDKYVSLDLKSLVNWLNAKRNSLNARKNEVCDFQTPKKKIG